MDILRAFVFFTWGYSCDVSLTWFMREGFILLRLTDWRTEDVYKIKIWFWFGKQRFNLNSFLDTFIVKQIWREILNYFREMCNFFAKFMGVTLYDKLAVSMLFWCVLGRNDNGAVFHSLRPRTCLDKGKSLWPNPPKIWCRIFSTVLYTNWHLLIYLPVIRIVIK